MAVHVLTSQAAPQASFATPPARCPVCARLADDVIEREGEVRVELCGGCGVAFVDPVPRLSVLQAQYDEHHSAEWLTGQQPGEQLWQARLAIVESLVAPRKTQKDLLDVGCGDGEFLRAARAAGFACTATELSVYAAERVRQELAIPVMAGTLREAGWPSASFDLVTMWHVLERLSDPRGELLEIYRLLRPGGRLIVVVPNRQSRVYNGCYRLVRGGPPQLYMAHKNSLHLIHFTPESLAQALERCGFRVGYLGLDVECVDWRKRWIDRLARVWHLLTGVNWSMAMLAVAEKPSDPQLP